MEGDEGRPSAETLLHLALAEHAGAGAVLHTHPEGASDQEILDAFKAPIEELSASGGYVTADVINVSAETPGLQEMLDRFNREHWHDEDEIRFVVAGRGLFHIHPHGGEVFSIEVTGGDMISVPRGTEHWFDLCGDRRIRAIRLEEFLSHQAGEPEVLAAIERLRLEHALETEGGSGTPPFGDGLAYARSLIPADRKSPGLKSLQGLLWKDGYQKGDLQGEVFADVPEAIDLWRQAGIRLRIPVIRSLLEVDRGQGLT